MTVMKGGRVIGKWMDVVRRVSFVSQVAKRRI